MNARRVQHPVNVIISAVFFPADQLDKKQIKSDITKNRTRAFETKNRDVTLFSMRIGALRYLPAYSQEIRPLQNPNLQLKSLPFVLLQFL